MAFRIIFLEEFGKAFVPKRVTPNLRKYLLKAGFNEVPYRFFGMLFYISVVITGLIFFFFVYPYITNLGLLVKFVYTFVFWAVGLLFFATLFILLTYFYLDLRVYQRTRRMEEQLPDFLQILAANLKGGMTFETALWGAIKPRFDVLGSEMAKASKKVMTGYEISKALSELTERYDSLMLRRTVDLIISEVESGGNVSNLIDRLVANIKETKELKDEMSASAVAYVIFISVIVIAISPLLFALSYHLLSLIVGFMGQLAVATQRVSNLPFSFSNVGMDPSDFRTFSLVAIFVISLFSSLIVSIVEKGDVKGGVKYIPIYVFGSVALYFLFLKVLGMVFGGII